MCHNEMQKLTFLVFSEAVIFKFALHQMKYHCFCFHYIRELTNLEKGKKGERGTKKKNSSRHEVAILPLSSIIIIFVFIIITTQTPLIFRSGEAK